MTQLLGLSESPSQCDNFTGGVDQSFPESPFTSPDFESETRKYETDSESESGPLMNIESETESETSLKTRVSVFSILILPFSL